MMEGRRWGRVVMHLGGEAGWGWVAEVGLEGVVVEAGEDTAINRIKGPSVAYNLFLSGPRGLEYEMSEFTATSFTKFHPLPPSFVVVTSKSHCSTTTPSTRSPLTLRRNISPPLSPEIVLPLDLISAPFQSPSPSTIPTLLTSLLYPIAPTMNGTKITYMKLIFAVRFVQRKKRKRLTLRSRSMRGQFSGAWWWGNGVGVLAYLRNAGSS